jgi:hypothetical protein
MGGGPFKRLQAQELLRQVEGLAKLSTDRDYSQVVKRVNANHLTALAVTCCLAGVSSTGREITLQLSKLIWLLIVAPATLLV